MSFSNDTVKRLDSAIAEQMQENELPGVVVGVWVPKEGSYVVAEGLANLRRGERRDLDDPFRIASITKTFVATAILQLVEEGKLAKTEKLSKWYPDFPNAQKITIEHLLRMQSGIVDPNDDLEYGSPEEEIQDSANRGIMFEPPGHRTEYANINYIILGEIISKVSGKETGDQITQKILKPLGMDNTVYPSNNDLPGDLHGYGYASGSGEFEDMTNFSRFPVDGAGGMISDVWDLKTWAKAVCTGELHRPETQRARLQTQPLQGVFPISQYAYGEGIMKLGGFCGHDGALPGFNSVMWYLPHKDATIVINVNRSDEDPFGVLFADLLALNIMKILFAKYASTW